MKLRRAVALLFGSLALLAGAGLSREASAGEVLKVGNVSQS